MSWVRYLITFALCMHGLAHPSVSLPPGRNNMFFDSLYQWKSNYHARRSYLPVDNVLCGQRIVLRVIEQRVQEHWRGYICLLF
jgi:hypothetical protein